MATLHRFARQCQFILRQQALCRCHLKFVRSIQSDKGNELKSTDGAKVIDQSEEFQLLREHFADTDSTKLKNWMSHGWADADRELDNFHHNLSMFSLFTIITVIGVFVLYYTPDYKLRDWTHREAYLDLDRRERKGQPAIDPYFVSPESVRLPTEAEIGDREIII